MKGLLSRIIFIGLLLFSFCSLSQAEDQAALEARLVYLTDLPEVSWVIFNDNNVYVGFSSRPRDMGMIVNAAALHGNRAYGFGVHIYAVPDSDRDKLPWGKWRLYCSASARYGKVTKNDCK